jgi:hypothetical protein
VDNTSYTDIDILSNHMSPFHDIVEFHYLKIPPLISHFIGLFSMCSVE